MGIQKCPISRHDRTKMISYQGHKLSLSLLDESVSLALRVAGKDLLILLELNGARLAGFSSSPRLSPRAPECPSLVTGGSVATESANTKEEEHEEEVEDGANTRAKDEGHRDRLGRGEMEECTVESAAEGVCFLAPVVAAMRTKEFAPVVVVTVLVLLTLGKLVVVMPVFVFLLLLGVNVVVMPVLPLSLLTLNGVMVVVVVLVHMLLLRRILLGKEGGVVNHRTTFHEGHDFLLRGFNQLLNLVPPAFDGNNLDGRVKVLPLRTRANTESRKETADRTGEERRFGFVARFTVERL